MQKSYFRGLDILCRIFKFSSEGQWSFKLELECVFLNLSILFAYLLVYYCHWLGNFLFDCCLLLLRKVLMLTACTWIALIGSSSCYPENPMMQCKVNTKCYVGFMAPNRATSCTCVSSASSFIWTHYAYGTIMYKSITCFSINGSSVRDNSLSLVSLLSFSSKLLFPLLLSSISGLSKNHSLFSHRNRSWKSPHSASPF